MVKLLDEHERTMAFAEVALGQIKSLRQTAVPRNYEIWYVYATGYNAPLNKIINETLARNGRLSESDLEQIYETYLSHIKTSDRIDKVGARVIGEIDDVMTLITEALGMSASYDASLTGASQKLSVARKPDQIKAVVEQLVKSTREMRETNKALENRLSLSKTEISNLQHSLEAIRAESLTDPLTGLGNRKYFDRSIDMAVQAALASGEPLSLLMFDIDHFKSFNDSYGHLTGDQVLRLVGMSLKQTIKGQDITARYGGEEFAHRFADRARRRLPLCRQAQRPQPRDLRSRPRIRRRDPQPCRVAAVVPANAGTHNHRRLLLEKVVNHLARIISAAAYGSLRSQGRRLFFLGELLLHRLLRRRLPRRRLFSRGFLDRNLPRLRPLLQRRTLGCRQRRPGPHAELFGIVEQPGRQFPVRVHGNRLSPRLVLKRF